MRFVYSFVVLATSSSLTESALPSSDDTEAICMLATNDKFKPLPNEIAKLKEFEILNSGKFKAEI